MNTWNEFDAKYKEVIGSIANSNAVGENAEADMGTASKMLIYLADNPGDTSYKGVPEGFDWEACRADVLSVREAIKAGM